MMNEGASSVKIKVRSQIWGGDLYQGEEDTDIDDLLGLVITENGKKPHNCKIMKGNLAPFKRDMSEICLEVGSIWFDIILEVINWIGFVKFDWSVLNR